jgi:hypothetical protein
LCTVSLASFDECALPTAAIAVAGRGSAWVVGVVNDINDTRAERRTFQHEIIAQFVHAPLVLIDENLFLHGTKKVGEILMLIAHIPAFVGEALASVVDTGKFLFEFFRIEFPGRLDGGSREDDGVGERCGRINEGGTEKTKESGESGAIHERGGVRIKDWTGCLCRARSLCRCWQVGCLGRLRSSCGLRLWRFPAGHWSWHRGSWPRRASHRDRRWGFRRVCRACVRLWRWRAGVDRRDRRARRVRRAHQARLHLHLLRPHRLLLGLGSREVLEYYRSRQPRPNRGCQRLACRPIHLPRRRLVVDPQRLLLGRGQAREGALRRGVPCWPGGRVQDGVRGGIWTRQKWRDRVSLSWSLSVS